MDGEREVRAASSRIPSELEDERVRSLRAELERQLAGRVPRDLQARIDVSDVVQDALLDAVRGMPRFEEQGQDGLRRWLAVIADNRLRMAVRAHRGSAKRSSVREARLDATGAPTDAGLAMSQTSPSQAVARGEDRERVQRAVAALSPAHRDVIERVRLRGESIADVAAAMGRTENAVKKLLARALLDLARELDSSK